MTYILSYASISTNNTLKTKLWRSTYIQTFWLKAHSIWTVLLDKHVNIAPYFLNPFYPSFIRKRQNMSTPQLLKVVHQLFYQLADLPSFAPKFPSQQLIFNTFPYQPLNNCLTLNDAKSIAPDFINGKSSSTMSCLLMTPFHNQSSDATIFSQ